MAEKNQDTMKSFNKVAVAGKLKLVELEKKKNDDKENYIGGTITIQYGADDDQQVSVKIYKKELTGSGSVAKAYEKLETLMKSGITIAKAKELTGASEDDTVVTPTVVRIYGSGDFTPQLELNEYATDEGKVNSRPQVSLGFGNIALDSVDSDAYKAEFHNVIFLHKDPKREKDSERLLVEGSIITYQNEIKPFTFIVDDEDMADEMENLEKGCTIEIWGDIKIAKIEKIITKKSGFGGKGHTEVDTSYVSELIITGGDMVDDSDKRWIDPAFIKKAMVARETFLDELKKKKADSGSKPKKAGFGGKPADTKKKKKDDIPF